MTDTWTEQAVAALAPDPESVRAGRALAVRSRWLSLACHGKVIWGECKGSGQSPYRARIDLSGPAYKCSCPSRKVPCKHVLGLFFFHALQPDAISPGDTPEWVAEWMASRKERLEKELLRLESRQAGPDRVADPTAQQKRQAERMARVSAGVEDLQRWMRDLVRTGLAGPKIQKPDFWEAAAARLVDAQAPGLARAVREMGAIPGCAPAWPDRLLESLGRTQLLIDAFTHLQALEGDLQAEVRTRIGFPVSREEVVRGEPVRDRWAALARTMFTDPEGLQVTRTWLRGRNSGRWALLVDFVHRSLKNEQTGFSEALPGEETEADLVFYPGVPPLRALVVERRSAHETLHDLPGAGTIEQAFCQWREAIARSPWTEVWPMAFSGVCFGRSGEAWTLSEPGGRSVPVTSRFGRAWELLALGGGEALPIFGLWDGEVFSPLSTLSGGRLVALSSGEEEA